MNLFNFKKGYYYEAVQSSCRSQEHYVNRGDTQAAFNSLASLINQHAVDGWEYHSMETITVTEKPGCFQQPVPMNYYMLIFVREV